MNGTSPINTNGVKGNKILLMVESVAFIRVIDNIDTYKNANSVYHPRNG